MMSLCHFCVERHWKVNSIRTPSGDNQHLLVMSGTVRSCIVRALNIGGKKFNGITRFCGRGTVCSVCHCLVRLFN